MHVSLTPELEQLVKLEVESGMYSSSSEIIREALRVWHEQKNYQKKLETLRAKLELAEQSPIVENFSIDGLIQDLDNKPSH
ncbi:MAG: type II toxin-antitoxin system ParD family antitoxin [Cellvibrionaceae bacterium]|nr:type II toxin-antitoxin system ParD family antitoxin [Cellvibrionaceae bacterium]